MRLKRRRGNISFVERRIGFVATVGRLNSYLAGGDCKCIGVGVLTDGGAINFVPFERIIVMIAQFGTESESRFS